MLAHVCRDFWSAQLKALHKVLHTMLCASLKCMSHGELISMNLLVKPIQTLASKRLILVRLPCVAEVQDDCMSYVIQFTSLGGLVVADGFVRG